MTPEQKAAIRQEAEKACPTDKEIVLNHARGEDDTIFGCSVSDAWIEGYIAGATRPPAPLVWDKDPYPACKTVFGIYTVNKGKDCFCVIFYDLKGTYKWGGAEQFHTLDLAKAAADEHYKSKVQELYNPQKQEV